MSTQFAQVQFADKETRKDAVNGLLEGFLTRLAENTDEYASSTEFKQLLDVASQFHNYSWGNCLLIASQFPGASRVAGFQSWAKKFNRSVKKGSKAIWILAPLIGKKKDKTGTEVSACYGFRTVPVFDFSQTEQIEGQPDLFGKPPSYRNTTDKATELVVALETYIAAQGWKLTYVDASALNGANGCTDGKTITVRNDIHDAQRAGTLIHEIAHCHLHFGEEKNLPEVHVKTWRETEAESVSYVVLKAHGIEQRSDIYIGSWGGTSALIKQSLGRILGVTRKVLNSTLEVGVEDATED